MPGFTSDEIQASINRFLTTQIESSRTRLGLRDTIAMRDAAYDILTTSLLLRPDSYFYLIWLTTNRLRGLITKSQADVASIDAQADSLAFRTKPIVSTTELTNARAAVLELNAGLASRTNQQGISGSIGPAVDRFRRSTERFIRTELTKNVVRAGQVTETPEEIRANLLTLLTGVLTRHEEIFTLVTAIAEAVSRYGRVQLPRRAVGDIVQRISTGLEAVQETLEGDNALAQSREAMLELLTMRTILSRASNFQGPRQALAPLVTDEQVLNLEAGVVPGSKTGTLSGPFNYDRATTNTFRVQVGTPPTQVDVVLPGGSNASVRSGILSFPFTPTGGAAIDVLVDGGGPLTMSPIGGPYANASALATYLDGLVAGLSVIAEGSRMIFFSDTFDDASSVEFDTSVGGADVFLADIPLESLFATAQGAELSAIRTAIGGQTTTYLTDAVVTDYGPVNGVVAAGDPDLIDASIVSVSDLVYTEDSAAVSSPTKNFEALGVRAGMAISITSPITLTATILSVEDGTLILDTQAPTSSSSGVCIVGPDYRGVPDGARVRLSAGNFKNTGLYRVSAGGGLVAQLELDRNLPDITVDDAVSATIETQFLKIRTVGVSEADGITAFPSDAGVSALGFTATATQARAAAVSAVPASGGVDFIQRSVKVGDKLVLSQSGVPFADQTITGVEAQRIYFSPGLEFQPSNDYNYRITSTRYNAWADLRVLVQAWLDDDALSDTTDFEFQVSRLIRGANPSAQITAAINTYEGGLAAILAALDAYVVPAERTIDNILRMLNEQGMDRALDLLVSLDVEEFFNMPPDSVSYSTHLVRTAAIVTRQVAPVGKLYKSLIPGSSPRVLAEQPTRFDPNAPSDVDQ